MKSAVIVFGAFLFMAPGFAADTAPAAQAEATDAKVDSHLAAALDLLEATNAKQNVGALIETMDSTVIGKVKQDHPSIDDKTAKAFSEAFREEMNAELPDLLKLQAAVYAEHFSEADLKALAAFYRSDTGKRFVAEQPAIMKEVMPLAFQWGQNTAMRAVEKATEKLKKEGMKL